MSPGSSQNVGITQTDEYIGLISFMHYGLGCFDETDCRLEPIDNPFGAIVLSMSQEWILEQVVHPTGFEPIRAFLTSNVGFPIDGIVMVLRRNGGGFSSYAYKKDGTPYISPTTHKKYALTEIDYTILNIVDEEGMRQREQFNN